jgi:hypothetical protein
MSWASHARLTDVPLLLSSFKSGRVLEGQLLMARVGFM